MKESTSPNTASDDRTAPAPGWRFRLGLALVVAGFLSPLGALLVPFTDLSTAMKATLSGLLIAGIPEVFTVAAVALLGKPGFAYVKNGIMAVLRRHAPPREVGRARYRLGLAMLLLTVLYPWVLMYTPYDTIPGFPEYQIHIGVVIDVIFVCSLFVLGGDFWDKVRALFVHRAKARFPDA